MSKGKAWTESEQQILIEKFEPSKQSVRQLSRVLNRSPSAISTKAWSLGLCPPNTCKNPRRWEPEEVEFLKEWAGQIPSDLLYSRHRQLCKQHGWRQRTPNAISLKVQDLGLSRSLHDSTDYYTVNNIAVNLRCSTNIVRSWLKQREYALILRPQTQGTHLLIRRCDLARFFQRYPAVLNHCRPEFPWLIDLVCHPHD